MALRLVAQCAKGPEAPALLLQARNFLAPASPEFTQDVGSASKASKGGTSLMDHWGKCKSATEQSMAMLQAYKDIGDDKDEPYLKFHNPRTFEDFDKAIPNFRKFGLKSGEVPKFFDTVLMKRASESVDSKDAWWGQRKAAAMEELKGSKPAAFPKLPVPAWQLGKGVSLDAMKQVTDAYVTSLVPARKLKLPELPAQVKALPAFKGLEGTLAAALADTASVTDRAGKVLTDFAFVSAAKLEARLATRRAEVHARWLKMWAKRILAQPEQAIVPLKERDALLASAYEDMDPKFNELVSKVQLGAKSYGERMADTAAMDTFFLKRSKQEVLDTFPVSDKDKEAMALAGQLEDKSDALEMLLGPALTPEAASGKLRSVELRERTEHLYTPDRYLYKEAMALVEAYEAEEAALRAQLEGLYGTPPTDSQIIAAQRAKSPTARLAEQKAEAEARVAALGEAKAAHAGNAYMQYALTKQQEFYSDASNVAFEEVLYPELVAERFAIEMAELDAMDAQIDEAEEEELWLLTLTQQSRHIAQHIQFDLPQAAVAHMDPLLYKKLDWETTHGLELLHKEAFQSADCEQGEYIKDQMGLENLSHHFLPLIRYRRAKARKMHGKFAAELSALPVKSTPV